MKRSELVWDDVRDGRTTPLLVDEHAASFGVSVVFSGRRGGRSEAPFDTLNLSPFIGDDPEAVAANQRSVEDAAGFEPGGLTLVHQVHGTDVLEARSGGRVAGDGDGLATTEKGLAIGVLTADCVPVLIKGEHGIAAAHAGWRGMTAGVIDEAAEKVGAIEAAWVGPSIHACCYEVGSEVLAAFEASGLPVAERREDGRGRVGPGRAAAVILHRLGAPYLSQSSICTSCDADFFSYRRDGKTGRQGGFITLI